MYKDSFDFKWSTGQTSATIPVDTAGFYQLTLSDSNYCGNLTINYLVEGGLPGSRDSIFNKKNQPNVFSPNGDGTNDVFRPIFELNPDLLIFEEYSLVIYDRWGKEVFKSSSYDTHWNGMFKGKEAVEDVYLYALSFVLKGCQGGPSEYFEHITGDVLLVR